MAGNFSITTTRTRGTHEAQIALIALGQNINEAGRINVAEIASKAAEFLREESPLGQTGNLKRSWLVGLPTQARNEGGQFLPGEVVEARAFLKQSSPGTFSNKTFTRSDGSVGNFIQRNDPAQAYALAVNNGRRALQGLFIWNRGVPSVWNGKSQGTKWVARNLARREGSDFIGRAQVRTDVYAAEKARTFSALIKNNNSRTNFARKESLGFPGT